jgi:hypothetical protein
LLASNEVNAVYLERSMFVKRFLLMVKEEIILGLNILIQFNLLLFKTKVLRLGSSPSPLKMR